MKNPYLTEVETWDDNELSEFLIFHAHEDAALMARLRALAANMLESLDVPKGHILKDTNA